MLFIAELGSMHKGIEALAYEMVRRAKMSGADAVKFQFGWPEGAGPIRRWAEANAKLIRGWCDYFQIQFGASVFSWGGLATAESCGVDYLKMAHPETFAKNAPFESYEKILHLCLQSGKPLYVSGSSAPGAVSLYCVPKYPVYQEELQLPMRFSSLWWGGYSSHTHGIEDALVAIGRGATVIEKHVTLDKTEESIKDNQFALSFEEFAEMVHIGRAMSRLT